MSARTFSFFRLDVVDDSGEVEERPRGDLDPVALGEVDLELGRFRCPSA